MAQELTHVGETRGASNHDRDLVQELSRRLDFVWRSDQYIANAQDDPALEEFWQELKEQEEGNVAQLKKLIGDEVRKGCF